MSRAFKFQTKDELTAFVKSLCKHLSEGYPRDTFPLASPNTIKATIKRLPVEQREEVDKAIRDGNLVWFKRLDDVASGAATAGQVTAIIFGLKNKMGWRDNAHDQTTAVNFKTKEPEQQLDELFMLRAEGVIESRQANDLAMLLKSKLENAKLPEVMNYLDDLIVKINEQRDSDAE